MRILLTGATGFVGRHFLVQLVKEHEVYSILRPGSRAALAPKTKSVSLDLETLFDADSLPSKVDVVIHLAQANEKFPEGATALFGVNTLATQRLADYAKSAGATRFIFASTGSVYQPTEAAVSEAAPTLDHDFYSFSKLSAERLLTFYRPDMDVTILRLFTPYGPGQEDRMIPKIINLVKNERPVKLINGGQPTVTPIYITDLVEVLRHCINLSGHHLLNVGGPEEISIKQIAQVAGKALKKEPEFIEEESQNYWNLIADTSVMKKLFPALEMIPPSKGISQMMASHNG